jgi:hypothetical protein
MRAEVESLLGQQEHQSSFLHSTFAETLGAGTPRWRWEVLIRVRCCGGGKPQMIEIAGKDGHHSIISRSGDLVFNRQRLAYDIYSVPLRQDGNRRCAAGEADYLNVSGRRCQVFAGWTATWWS